MQFKVPVCLFAHCHYPISAFHFAKQDSHFGKCPIQHQPIEIKSGQRTRSVEINGIKRMEKKIGTKMQTEGPKIHTGLLELRQISAFWGSSQAGNLKFVANSDKKA